MDCLIMAEFFDLDTNEESGVMAIKVTAETWVRIDLFCDGLGNDGICLLGASDELERISDVAPTAEGARKAILNAAIRHWHSARVCYARYHRL